MKQNITIISAASSSLSLAERVQKLYPDSVICDTKGVEQWDAKAIIFIGAMGICVRTLLPYLKDKHIDPPVVCIDSTGKYMIPVLSGHIGGANALSLELAERLGGQAIITTQSDNTGLWALDTIGEKYDWIFAAEDPNDTLQASNHCIAAFVNRKATALLLDIRDKGTDYLEKTRPMHVDVFYKFTDIPLDQYELLISVSPFINEVKIKTICYYPKVLHLGMGCRKGIQGDVERLYEDLIHTIVDQNICPDSIISLSSIDLKSEEPMLLSLASDMLDVPFNTYPSETLNAIEVPNPSEKVMEVTCSGSVAEAAARKSAHRGPLLLEKQKGKLSDGNDYTFAIAIESSVVRQGHIEIVGAGPGDPDLISIRGRRMLEAADLILYAGSLVPVELTHCAKADAIVRSSADLNLEEQFALMKKHYDKGHFIVRLHTGDPCIYGAIQEQMAYFDEYGMRYHITPGISSFQAAAAALRSQFTIPEKVQTIILTRGEGRTPMPEKEQLHKLAASQSTMCIYLSAGIVEQVQEELLAHYAPTTPVAACYRLTWKDECIYRGELKDLARIVKENKLTLTTLLVIGEAIDNRKGLSRLYADEFKHLFRK